MKTRSLLPSLSNLISHFIQTPLDKVDGIAVLVYVVLEETIGVSFIRVGRWIFWAFGGEIIILFERVVEESVLESSEAVPWIAE